MNEKSINLDYQLKNKVEIPTRKKKARTENFHQLYFQSSHNKIKLAKLIHENTFNNVDEITSEGIFCPRWVKKCNFKKKRL